MPIRSVAIALDSFMGKAVGSATIYSEEQFYASIVQAVCTIVIIINMLMTVN